ncbi:MULTISPECIES: fibronectin type III domain-containing protein [unclassified Crossiella]|uniref:fibronectin type III domain-containing protein n=1 Tax=unclassified Crossiella TaxID=2620835 RepID=UPI00200013BB|nr:MULTISPECIES: hypothetical protein [unclassified Crossiella]MCK2241439.1 hypothetical protein [Crossiella sp. S99.2]MCK2255689.1 hypothetical protein [Crossiella sp. S99.1]
MGAGRLRAAAMLSTGALTLALLQPVTATAAPEESTVDVSAGGVAQKPYLGWSSWSLQATKYPGVNPTGPASWLTEQNVLAQADVMAAKLRKHGYEYVNVDAGWAGGFDEYGRPLANPKTFPRGIKFLGDYLHRKGLKMGSYLAVGLDPAAYRDGGTPIFGAPGCHTRDIVYPDLRRTNGWDSAYRMDFGNPCAEKYLDSLAAHLAGWGVDLLKLDGVGPGSFKGGPNYDNTADVAAWSRAIKRTGRPMEVLISWALTHTKAAEWKRYTTGWRIDTDVECYCETLVKWDQSVRQRWTDVVQWIDDAGPGHWNNLDSVNVGNGEMDGLTEAERQSYLTFWAIQASPLYLGDDLTTLDSYGLSLITNDEVIAVNQAGKPARPVSQASDQQVWSARNDDGSYTVALFNLGAAPATVRADWRDVGFTGEARVRDLWSHRELGRAAGFSALLPAHGSRLLRVTPPDRGDRPTIPTIIRGTGTGAGSLALAWQPSAYRKGISGYDVLLDGNRVRTVSGPGVTLTGLEPGSAHRITVLAVGKDGRKSLPSTEFPATVAGGPSSYEGEDQANVLTGGAGRSGCSGCAQGGKAGNLGVSGTLTFPAVTVPADGTYLMTIDYVAADSGRTAVLGVGEQEIQIPMAGSNDNEWDRPQRITVPVRLKAGANAVRFGNPREYVADIDKITV